MPSHFEVEFHPDRNLTHEELEEALQVIISNRRKKRERKRIIAREKKGLQDLLNQLGEQLYALEHGGRLDSALLVRHGSANHLASDNDEEEDSVEPEGEPVLPKDSKYSEPNTFDEAMAAHDKDQWIIAWQKEINSLIERGSWKWVRKFPGMKRLGSKWVFKVKLDKDGSINK